MPKRTPKIIYIYGFILILALARTAYLQLWDGPNSGFALAEKALKYRTQALAGEEYCRGEILDRNLVSLTDSGIRPVVAVYPTNISNIPDTAQNLASLLGLEKSYIENLLKRGKENYGVRAPVIIKTNLTAAEISAIEKLKNPGVTVLPLKTRYGPQALAAHLIGYLNSIDGKQWEKLTLERRTAESNGALPTAYKITDKIGVAGLEGKYEQVLKGSRPQDRILAITDGSGRILPGIGTRVQEEANDPWRNHLVLTLDKKYQEIVEQVMDQEITRGAVAVIDIPTGNVLACASRPNFKQDEIYKYLSEGDELLDRCGRVAFYPGSVFKMVIAAGVLEEKLVTTSEEFQCSGAHLFADQTEIKCLSEHGTVDLADAISRSCNTTFVQLGLRLGGAKLAEYAAKLGFTISVGGNSPPALVGNAAIGQEGVLVSPLQIANLYATLGRNGYYRPWRIVSEIRNYQGDVIQEYPGKPPVQVISENTCEILIKDLARAVQAGSGKQAWLQEGGTAGKTGTAQANDTNKVIAWFAGFTPVESPRLAIAVMVEEDTHGLYTGLRGGETAAPVFKKIVEQINDLRLYP